MRTRASVGMIAFSVLGLWLAAPGLAHAHFNLLTPPPADTSTGGGKGAPPCGPLTPASNVVTKVQGGHPLMVSVMETVPHPGFYRIALSINSRAELPADNVVYDSTGKVLSPTGTPSGNSAKADYEDPPVFPVLADNLWPHQGTAAMMFQTMITLPNVTCAKCTLQVIEFMNMHGPNPGGAYFYHHCADLQITADPALPGPDAGATDAGSTGTDAAGAAGRSGSGGNGSMGGVSGTGGGLGATGGNGTTAGTGGNNAATGGSGTGGSIVVASGGATATGGTVAPGSGGHPGSGGTTVADAGTNQTGGGSSGCSMAGARDVGGAVGPLAVVFLGLSTMARRRRAARRKVASP